MADKLSELPDSILHHILSFLPMNYVVATSVLAKRYRYLWTSCLTLNFDEIELHEEQSITKFITPCLLLYEGEKIQKLRIRIYFENVEDCYLDSWIRFAKRHHVEEIDIELLYGFMDHYVTPEDESYVIPGSLFDCKALRLLSLSGCQLNPLRSFCFQYLKKLNLCMMELSDVDTSGCLLLEELVMSLCNIKSRLKIYAPNPTLRYMKISDPSAVCSEDTDLEIYAPHLLSLKISGFMRQNYKLKNLTSIETASLDFSEMFSPYDVDDDDDHNVDDPNLLRGLLESVGHAKTVKLCQYCIQILSLKKARKVGRLQISVTRLELGIPLNKIGIQGLSYILKNSHCLQTLTVKIIAAADVCDFMNDYCFEEHKCWKTLKPALLTPVHLKTITMASVCYETECSPYDGYIDMDSFSSSIRKEITLLKLFLQCCNELEKVSFKIPVPNNCRRRPKFLRKLSKELLALPKASANAEICLY